LPRDKSRIHVSKWQRKKKYIMQKIQMVDLKSQYDKIKTSIDLGIKEVIDSTSFIKGPQIKVFEETFAGYLNVKHVIACANGTDALQIAMMALGLERGDEVIIPVFTYVATAEVIALLGLTPVLVDVDDDTFCIDSSQIESKITTKTKAIVPVHLYGQCSNMMEILTIAEKYKLLVVEDTAQAVGAKVIINDKWECAGTIGNIGTTSFFPSKNLGCFGDGGALLTNDDILAEKIRIICNHGQRKQYIHDVIGVNSRLDSIQAAVLIAKLPYLHEYENARNFAAAIYDKLLSTIPEIVIPYRDTNSTHVFHQYTIQLKNLDRDALKSKLSERKIPSMIYYPIPLNRQKAFEIYKEDEFPIADKLCSSVLSLPMHTEMSQDMISYICSNIIEIIEELKLEKAKN
jgi:UDP-2-acetamido-2-deoxy-ribo-hexuluronate aminotransferase